MIEIVKCNFCIFAQQLEFEEIYSRGASIACKSIRGGCEFKNGKFNSEDKECTGTPEVYHEAALDEHSNQTQAELVKLSKKVRKVCSIRTEAEKR